MLLKAYLGLSVNSPNVFRVMESVSVLPSTDSINDVSVPSTSGKFSARISEVIILT